jgi:hypothetical protein
VQHLQRLFFVRRHNGGVNCVDGQSISTSEEPPPEVLCPQSAWKLNAGKVQIENYIKAVF